MADFSKFRNEKPKPTRSQRRKKAASRVLENKDTLHPKDRAHIEKESTRRAEGRHRYLGKYDGSANSPKSYQEREVTANLVGAPGAYTTEPGGRIKTSNVISKNMPKIGGIKRKTVYKKKEK